MPISAELEQLEMMTTMDLFDAMPQDLSLDWGAQRIRTPDGVLMAMKNVPFQFFNRSLGLGIEQPVTEHALDHVVQWLHANAQPPWGLDILEPSGEISQWLADRGLVTTGDGRAKLWRSNSAPVPAAACEFAVKKIGQKDAHAFGSLVQQSFGLPETTARWFGALVGRKHWHCYLVKSGSTPVSAAALRIVDSMAVLSMGATLPMYRGRGAQSALIARRVNDAIALGAKHIVSTVQFPSDVSRRGPSLRNMLKAGFTVSYVRPTYVTR
jgi:hypothetical protein